MGTGRFEVDPDQVTQVGAAIAGLAPSVTQVAWGTRSLGSAASGPPLTAAALARLGQAWGAGAERLAEELTSLGRTADAAGFLYRHVDETAILPSEP